jgi:hypothetical protein
MYKIIFRRNNGSIFRRKYYESEKTFLYWLNEFQRYTPFYTIIGYRLLEDTWQEYKRAVEE